MRQAKPSSRSLEVFIMVPSTQEVHNEFVEMNSAQSQQLTSGADDRELLIARWWGEGMSVLK